MIDPKPYAKQIMVQMATQNPPITEELICSWLNDAIQASHHYVLTSIASNDPEIIMQLMRLRARQQTGMTFQGRFESEVIKANDNQ